MQILRPNKVEAVVHKAQCHHGHLNTLPVAETYSYIYFVQTDFADVKFSNDLSPSTKVMNIIIK